MTKEILRKKNEPIKEGKGSFDYVYLHSCQFEVNSRDCGEPAIAEGSWLINEGTSGDIIHLCEKHLNIILADERQERKQARLIEQAKNKMGR